jgi:hypothetical protein
MGDRGQGRKPLPPEEQTKPRSVRLNDTRWDKLKALNSNGSDWLNRAIDKAKIPSNSPDDAIGKRG